MSAPPSARRAAGDVVGDGTPVADFDYELPPERIALRPAAPRGASRLMVVEPGSRRWTHDQFRRLPEWLRAGDLLVRNDTKVFPARLEGRTSGGRRMEVLLVRREECGNGGETWSCLARPGRRLRSGEPLALPGGIRGTWLEPIGELRRIRLFSDRPILDVVEEVGEVPLPPYIRRPADAADRRSYQTIYARAVGSVAAPTAGLHFTPEVFDGLARRGVECRSLTLHVGPGTFLPVRATSVEAHRMLPEEVEIPEETVQAVLGARREGRRVIAVGTTTVRALEGMLR
ncbi:MAG: S-adenosylmethionine:tRNA ribosyltransferase-isomerase, partial [Candidatus Binatia bacterium]